MLVESAVECRGKFICDFLKTVGLIPNLSHLLSAVFDILVVILVDIAGGLYEIL